jgi:hypothetical protein
MDVLVIVKRRLPSLVIKSINKEVNSILSHHYEHDDHRYGFTVNVFQLPVNELVYSNDVKAYDTKYASSLIYGQDIRKEIRISLPTQISKFSSIRILFNKVLGLYFFAPMSGVGDEHTEEKVQSVMECAKTYVELGTVACLLDGKYVPSYKKRQAVLPEIPWLSDRLKKLIVQFTELKLHPSLGTIETFNPRRLWLHTRNDLMDFLFYAARRQFGLEHQESILSYADDMLGVLEKYGLQDLAEFYLKHRFGISSGYIARPASWLYQRYFALSVMRELRSKALAPRLRVLWTSPLFYVYCQALILLNSIKHDFSISRHLQELFIKRIDSLIPLAEMNVFDRTTSHDDASLYSRTREILSLLYNNIQQAYYGG